MPRYIDANELFRETNKKIHEANSYRMAVVDGEFLGLIRDAPTADVAEVKHGNWVYEQLDNFKMYKVICIECNAEYIGNYDAYNEPEDFNYCPNCGAKMDGGEMSNEKSFLISL